MKTKLPPLPGERFTITKVEAGPNRTVHVHVTYEGGALVLPYKDTLPSGTIRAQVRAEVRRRLNVKIDLAKLAERLVGDHEV